MNAYETAYEFLFIFACFVAAIPFLTKRSERLNFFGVCLSVKYTNLSSQTVALLHSQSWEIRTLKERLQFGCVRRLYKRYLTGFGGKYIIIKGSTNVQKHKHGDVTACPQTCMFHS